MFRGEDIYTFPLGNSFGNFSAEEKEILTQVAKDLHKHIGAKHYLKSDFVLNSRGKVYLLQIESMPDLKPDSHFSQVCESVGAKMHYVVEHILEQA
jgi:D-alanine-D-alanine ligase-like ATP-grasp enzyme